MKPNLHRIEECLNVDVVTGRITWRRSQGRMAAGALAGRIHRHGYRVVMIDKMALQAHAIVWFVATGDWPERIDHINGVRDDNRFVNLREADAATNARNRTNWQHRKLLGAYKRPNGTFAAAITADGVVYELGVFRTEMDAHLQYVEARKRCADAELIARRAVLEEMQVLRVAA